MPDLGGGEERKKGRKWERKHELNSGICKFLLFACPFCSASATCHTLPLLGVFCLFVSIQGTIYWFSEYLASKNK